MKYVSILIVTFLTLILAGCGSGGDASTSSGNGGDNSSENTNQGIRDVFIGSKEPVSIFPGSSVKLGIQVESVDDQSPPQGVTFQLDSHPDWVTLDNDILQVTPPTNTASGDYDISIITTANGVTIEKRASVKITIINEVTLVSGQFNENGGEIRNQWQDIIIKVNAGDLSQEYSIVYSAGINDGGGLSFSFKTTPEMPINERLKIKVIQPDSDIIKNNYILPELPAEQKSQTKQNKLAYRANASASFEAKEGVFSDCKFAWRDGNSPVPPDNHAFNYIWQGNKANFHMGVNTEGGNFLTNRGGHPRLMPGIYAVYGTETRCASALRSTVKWDNENELKSKEPVLFIHGFINSGQLGGLDVNPELLGDDIIEEYFGSFPKMVDEANFSGREFNSFLFQWRTNARFQDVADELGTAIREITAKTGKQVHIVAHSFGGLLTRTLVQGLSTNATYYGFKREFAEKNIATITTVGTPHSGIFSRFLLSNFRNIEFDYEGEIKFPIGTDGVEGVAINLCEAITCHQAGQKSETLSRAEEMYGIRGDQAGYIVYKIAKTVDQYPNIPTQVLMGIVPADVECRKSGDRTCRLTYTIDSAFTDHPGDTLISIEGQRFLPNLGLDSVYNTSFINEHILPLRTKNFTVGSDDSILDFMRGGLNESFSTRTYFNEIPIEFNKNIIDGRDYPKIAPVSLNGFYYGNKHRSGTYKQSSSIYSIRGFKETIQDEGGNNIQVEQLGYFSIKHLTEVGLHNCSNLTPDNCIHPTWLYFKNIVTQNEAQLVTPDVGVYVTGTVVQAIATEQSTTPVPNATVKIYQGNTFLVETKTDSNGLFKAQVVFRPNTSYHIIVDPPFNWLGSLRSVSSDSITTSDTADETGNINFPKINLSSTEFAQGSLAISVTDGSTGRDLYSYIVEIKNHIGYPILAESIADPQSFDLPAGRYTVKISKPGYFEREQVCTLTPNTTSLCAISIVPTEHIAEGTLTAVLTWQINPRDLDSHLIKFDEVGNQQYHIYYRNRRNTLTGDNLDVDDRYSYGPETVTIQNIDPTARYVYAVHDYAGTGSITSTSGAIVNVQTSTISRTYNAPTTGSGSWWKVFEVINSRIIPCQTNCIVSDSSAVVSVASRRAKIEGNEIPSWLSTILSDSFAPKTD